LDMRNHTTVCDLYIKISNLKVVCYEIEKSKMMYYNEITTLWTEIGINELSLKVSKTLRNYICEKMKTITKYEDESYNKLLKCLGNLTFVQCVAKLLCSNMYDSEFVSKLNADRTTINFTNGILNLETQTIRKRTIEDYVSKCLNFDYTDKVDETVTKSINDLIFKISNENDTLKQDNLKWLAYCMTGFTREQKFMCFIGHSASNGKSTLSKLFESALPIYTSKLQSQTFNKDFTKRHKQFALLENPIRYVYIEELDRKPLDEACMKDFVDGHAINNEIMYGTSKMINIQCKLNLIGNMSPNFDSDEGMKRRGCLQNLCTKFCEKNTDAWKDAVSKNHRVYECDKSLAQRFTTLVYQLSFIQILLPYASDYIKNGLQLSNELTSSFKDLCQDNDKVQDFINGNYTITNNPKDKIHKDDFLESYRIFSNLKFIAWSHLLNDVKRLGLNYQKNLSTKGKQGCIVGIKIKNSEDDTYDDGNDEVDTTVIDIVEPVTVTEPKITQPKTKSPKNKKPHKNVFCTQEPESDNTITDFKLPTMEELFN